MCRDQAAGVKSARRGSAPAVLLGAGLSSLRSSSSRPHSPGRSFSGERPLGPVETIALSSLSHSFSTPPGTKERLLIRLRDLKLEDVGGRDSSMDVLCSVAVGPTSALSGTKGSFIKKECEVHNGAMEVIMDLGQAPSKEPWTVSLRLRSRLGPFSAQHLAEVKEVIPMPATTVLLKSTAMWWSKVGTATLEVLRLIPGSARESLLQTLCAEIGEHRPAQGAEEVVQNTALDRFCTSVQELCCGSGARSALESVGLYLLDTMVSLGRLDAAQVLMAQGVEPTVETVCAAENVGSFDLAHRLVERLRPRVAGTKAKDAGLQLVWALQQKLPGLADRILEHFPGTLRSLPSKPGSPAAKMAFEVGALRVLAALIKRGDPPPVPVREMLATALDAGNVCLAQACLSETKDLGVDDVVRICLGHESSSDGRQLRRAPTVMVREALEARWRVRNSQQKGCNSLCEGPALLALAWANGSQEDPAECSICFEPLHSSGPSVFLHESGVRSCPHFFCQSCAEHVKVDAKKHHEIFEDELLAFDFPPSRQKNCPMCRREFSTTARLPDPTVDPCMFFQYACLPETYAGGEANDSPRKILRLTEKAAYEALCAVLPVDPSSFREEFTNTLWPAWTTGKQARTAGLTEADFAASGGMLSWVGDHLIEFKVEQQRGQPPQLVDNPEAWFRHFDYDCNGLLSKNEVLRGIVKVANTESVADPTTASNHSRCDGVQRLRDFLDGIWNAARWKHGVPMQDFLGTEGLASRLLTVLPEESRLASRCPSRTSTGSESISVEEALAKARAADLADRQSSTSKESKDKCLRHGTSLQSAAYGSQMASIMSLQQDLIETYGPFSMPRTSRPTDEREEHDTTLDVDTTQEVAIQDVRTTRAGATPARDSHIISEGHSIAEMPRVRLSAI